jgi:TubC N-terminal docking domain
MTAPVALLREARDAGVALAAEGGRVRLSADDPPSPELLARLCAHKAELLGLLTGTHCRRCGTHLDYRHDWSTRAFADGTGSCGPCYYLEAAARAVLSPAALADEAELTVRGEELP